MTNFKQPPYVNGEMVLTDEQVKTIKDQLLQIQTGFVPSDEQPVCDTFYLVSSYNKENQDLLINGDTAEMLLSEDVPQEEV
jgi:hypothetical protein